MTKMITIGDLSRTADELVAYAKKYLQTPETYAYPAYDGYKGSTGTAIEECDLLAISLLNAGSNPIRTFYSLKSLVQPINDILNDERMTGTLANAGQAQIDAIADLFGLLDQHKSPMVGLTKLSKLVHRKMPALIPLFDSNVRSLYSHRVPVTHGRSDRDFALAWLPEVQEDLRRNEDFLLEITALADPSIPITTLRALDILAWNLGGQVRKK